jgi:uncharacterized protein YggL (DUF469 family)
MKKRLRKKLEQREFQKECISIGLVLEPIEKDPDSSAYFWNRLTEFVTNNGLYLLGGGDANLLDVVVFTNYNLVPIPAIKESVRYLLRDWLRQQPEVRKYRIGPRARSWHFYHQH